MTEVDTAAEAPEAVQTKENGQEKLTIPESETTSLEKTEAQDKATAPSDDDIEYPHGLKLVSIMVALCFAVFLVALDQTIIATAIPRITDRFNSIQDIGWYGSAYFLTSTGLQPTYGRIYKIFSVKYVFLIVICLFELGSLICGAAPSSAAFIVGRAVAGLGGGGIFSGAIVILAYCLPIDKRPLAFGIFGAMFGIASVAGPLLGGVFTDKITWRFCFYINLPIGVVAIVIIAFFLKIPRQDNVDGKTIFQRIRELDLLGVSALFPAVVCLLLALQWGGSTYPWKSSRIIGLLVGAALLSSIFVAIQFKLGEQATLPPRFFKLRTVSAAVAFAFFFGASFFILVFYLPLYFQSVKGSTATKSGIQVLPLLLATVISSIVTGGIITVTGYYTPFLIICMALFAVGSGLISTYQIDTPLARWFGYQVLAGAGIGIGFQAPITAVQTVLPLEDIPIGTVCVTFAQSLGGALFISVGQTVFQNGLVNGVHKYLPGVDPEILLRSGATDIKKVLTNIGQADKLPLALKAYLEGLTHAYLVTVSCAVAAIVAACFLEWNSVKKVKFGDGGAAAAAV